MVVNNFDLIKKLLRFDDKDDFYFCQVIQRKKDGNNVPSANNGYRTIKTYYIRSIDDYERRIPAIIQLCEQNNARAYINPNVRNAREVALQCSKAYIDLVIENRCNQGHRVYDHCCGITPKKGVDKLWIVDVDTHDPNVMGVISDAIERCRSGHKIGNDEHGDLYYNIVVKIPTINGVHFISRGFDCSQLRDKISYCSSLNDVSVDNKIVTEVCKSIKKDNPTLLYFNARNVEITD